MTRHIQIECLSKHYRIGAVQRDMMLRERLMEFVKRPFGGREDESDSLWALRDVSFEVNAGEVVGIIGRNGAGKSTLLKILSKITYPTSGSVRVKGRVAALLEVGTGFHDELTGRENIYLNGSILGMRKREVDERFDAIVDFSGGAQFIDTPVKRYSSGMRLRLGFAVAAHLDPDVLVVDEVLAVGDAAFQKKCIKAMEGLHSGGRTVLFVSHNMAAVENLCSRGIWIDGGKIQMDGAAKDVIARYMATSVGDQAGGAQPLGGDSRLGNGEIRYTRVEYLSLDGTPCGTMRSGDPMVLRLHYHAKANIRHPSFGFRLYTQLGTLITETGNVIYGMDIPKLEPGNGYIDVVIESLNLLPARYTLSLWITEVGGLPVYDGDARIVLDVEASDAYGSGHLPTSWQGIVYFPQRWRLSETQ